jgi:hypothetical protein
VPTPKQSHVQQHDQQLLQGISQALQQVPSLYLGGTAYTPAALSSLIQSRLAAADQVNTAKVAWNAAVKAYATTNRQVTEVVRDLRLWLLAAYGPHSPEMAAFGFTGKPRHAAGKAANRHAVKDAKTEAPRAKKERNQ